MSTTTKAKGTHMLAEIDKKVRVVTTVITALEKQFGKGAIMSLGDQPAPNVQVIQTGSQALDHALGIGGYPRGRIVEIYGHDGVGTTTLALHAMREAQRAGGVAAFIDAAHALNLHYARSIGIDTERLLVSQPDSDEQTLEIVEVLTRSGAVEIIAIDSVAALARNDELDGDLEEARLRAHQTLLSGALRKLIAAADRTGTTLLFINKMDRNTSETTGGTPLTYYASVRLDVRRSGPVNVGGEAGGSRTRVKVVKNKLAPPFQEAEFEIRWGTGIYDAAKPTHSST